MHEFRVWAPRPQKISVKVNDSIYAMQGPDKTGHWKAKVEEVRRSSRRA